jgi:guanylate kinase
MSKGKLFVMSGASGVGKSTVLSQVMAQREDLKFSVSATTRAPRPGETEGVSYYFITKEQFLKMIDEEAFIEYDAHMDNYYGTPIAQLEEKLLTGSVILDIEPNGAFHVLEKRPDATLIFIAPPSLEELERRLRSRGDTSEEQIRLRLDRVQWEMEQSKRYHYVVTNSQVETCAAEILNIIAEKAD